MSKPVPGSNRWRAATRGLVVAATIAAFGCSTQTSPSSVSTKTSTASTTTTTTTTTTATTTGAYTQSGGVVTKTNQTFTSSATDTSAVLVSNGGVLTLTNCTVTTGGNTSSQDNSSFYGQNAAVLAQSASRITMSGGSITTTGTGSSVVLSDAIIRASANGAHGVMATQAGAVTLANVTISTAGTNAGAIATDRGGGTITVTGGTIATSGQDSPGIYSTGAITVSNAVVSATGAEAAVIEGGNSIALANISLSSSEEGRWGVMLYQSMSGDASGSIGTFKMSTGSLSYTSSSGALFYVTNATGVITLTDVSLAAGSGVLLKAAAGSWGSSGSNGGAVTLTADAQVLSGTIVVDSMSSVTTTLRNGPALTGAINTSNTAKDASLSLDASSTWTVTADSYLTGLSDAAGISGTTFTNIIGKGYTVYYDATASASSQLNGQTYTLAAGGRLMPR